MKKWYSQKEVERMIRESKPIKGIHIEIPAGILLIICITIIGVALIISG